MTEYHRWTAVEAVSRLRNGDVTPLELIDAAAARIAVVEPSVNALPTLCLDRARERALNLPRPAGDDPGHLFGLPVVIKDLTEVAGVRTTFGSSVFTDHVPQASDMLVTRLEGRAASIIAKSNTPEFGAGAQTFNDVFGITRNPWNTALTPGGSSGGSAVAVTTGEAWLAHGGDLGGSLRIPASFCGCVGLRPSPGRVPRGPVPLPFNPNWVDGPIARNVGDIALFLDALGGIHDRDPISLPRPSRSFQSALGSVRPPRRIAFSMDLGASPVHPAVRAGTEAALKLFTDMGTEIVPLDMVFTDAEPMFQTLRAAQFAGDHGETLALHREKLKPEVVWNIGKGMALTADEIGLAERARGALYQRFVRQFDTVDLIVLPTVNTPPFPVGVRYLEELDGQKFDSYVSWLLMTFAISLTTCPAISVPCGFTPDGLPLGLQLVAGPRDEANLLGMARHFEDAAGLRDRLPIDPIVRH